MVGVVCVALVRQKTMRYDSSSPKQNQGVGPCTRKRGQGKHPTSDKLRPLSSYATLFCSEV